MPAPIVSFKGLDEQTWGAGWPPDTVGDVGPNHFVQAVNTSFGVFSKTGTMLAASTFNNLWSGASSGTLCDNSNRGDVTVVYDPMADRWIIGDFAFSGDASAPPYFECIAVSKTNNPVTGGWWLYAIRGDDTNHPWFPDYPKMGIWPDGLYMTANMFAGATTFEEVRVWAFNRSDLESGAALHSVIVDLGDKSLASIFTLLPSNLRGALPPAGRENLLVSESQTSFDFDVFKFHVDYSGSGSTFTGPTQVSQTNYTLAADTVPTPGNSLDSLADRMMMQAQYRNINGVESVWVNHTVRTSSTGPNGIQWAQIDVTGGTISTTPVQQQIYGNLGSDGLGRWMGSLAVDNNGDMALGYSAANASTNPDIRYNGRLATDPLNTLPQGETSMLQGVTRATQTGNCGGNPCTRWGDYSAMSLDPDGCTFWYTNEYYEANGLDWQTRIGSFKFPSCGTIKLKKGASTASYDHVGQVITYTYTITNSTAITLSGPFSVSDDKLGVINPCGTGPLPVGAHTSCTRPHTINQADLDAGSITNNALASTMNVTTTITSLNSSVTITATQSTVISLGKSAKLTNYDHVGQVITYTFTITNAGNVTLPGPLSVTDNKLGTVNPCGSGPLAPNAHTGCKAAHGVTQADIDNGNINNTATASTTFKSAPVTSPPASTTVTAIQNPALTLAKKAGLLTYNHVGQVITYTFTITNGGNVSLPGPFTISDNKLGSVNPCGSGPIAPHAHTGCTVAHGITQADLDTGSITNTATASTTFKGAPVASPSASATITAVQNPHISLTRHTSAGAFARVGDMITYSFAATNDGNLTLNTVIISDTLVASLNCTPGQPATLAPGGQLSCTGSYNVQQSDVDSGSIGDTASVTGAGPQSQPVSAQVSGSIGLSFEVLLPIIKDN